MEFNDGEYPKFDCMRCRVGGEILLLMRMLSKVRGVAETWPVHFSSKVNTKGPTEDCLLQTGKEKKSTSSEPLSR